MQKEVGVGTCEFHIFDMGDYQHIIPSELKRAYYHQWGLKKRGVRAPNVLREYKLGDTDKFHSLHATMKQLGHDMLDVIDVFVRMAMVIYLFIVFALFRASAFSHFLTSLTYNRK